jgi:hypothetical protein
MLFVLLRASATGSDWFRGKFRATRHFADLIHFAAMSALAHSHVEYDRIPEITEILAAGFMRVVARKSSPISANTGESLLDISPDQSGDPTPVDRRTPDA